MIMIMFMNIVMIMNMALEKIHDHAAPGDLDA